MGLECFLASNCALTERGAVTPQEMPLITPRTSENIIAGFLTDQCTSENIIAGFLKGQAFSTDSPSSA